MGTTSKAQGNACALCPGVEEQGGPVPERHDAMMPSPKQTWGTRGQPALCTGAGEQGGPAAARPPAAVPERHAAFKENIPTMKKNTRKQKKGTTLPCAQVLGSRVDQLLHGPQPLCQSAMAEQVGAIFQEHACLPFLQGSRPYLRSI